MFIIYILIIFSIDCYFGFWSYLLWRYLDTKYFSETEVELLKSENEYLKKENLKVK